MKRAALVLAFLLPVAAGTGCAGPRRAPRPTASTPGMARPAADTSDGAVDAAVRYAVAAQDWLYLSDEDVDRAVRSLATTDAAEALSRDAVHRVHTARAALQAASGPVWWLVRPLAIRVDHFDATTARVTIWTVTVLAAPGVALPQADWSRLAMQLVWADAAWRINNVDQTVGPTPATGSADQSWQAEPFDNALQGFRRVETGQGR